MKHLLVIDPQNDFCDLPADWCAPGEAPSLAVMGAHADLSRVAELIEDCGEALGSITLTLDSHERLDVAHPGFWRTRDGGNVAPFTQISAHDVETGRYQPRQPAHHARVLAYTRALEERGRYALCVWPVHCEVGSWGHAVHAGLRRAYNRWEEQTQRSVYKVLKGQNPFTEHYSALAAEVPDPNDPSTQLHGELLRRLGASEEIWIAGEASSHCVRATVLDLLSHLPGPERLVLLTDATSPVAGFGAAHDELLATCRTRGVRLATTTEVRAELPR